MRKTSFVVFIALVALAAVLLAACSEAPPGEVTGKVTKNGHSYGAVMKAINSSGIEVNSDQTVDGVYAIGNLPAGLYTIKCCDMKGNILGEKEIEVEPDSSMPLNFNLDNM